MALAPIPAPNTPNNPSIAAFASAAVAHIQQLEADVAKLQADVAALQAIPSGTQPLVSITVTAADEATLGSLAKGGFLIINGPTYSFILQRT